MWLASRSDKIKGLTKNLTDFAKEVVTPSFEASEFDENVEDVEYEENEKQERYETLVRSLRDNNALLQRRIDDLSQQLESKEQELSTLKAASKHSDESAENQAVFKSQQKRVVELEEALSERNAAFKDLERRYLQVKHESEQCRSLFEKQRQELMHHAESQLAASKEEQYRLVRDLYSAITGEAVVTPRSGDEMQTQVEQLIGLASTLRLNQHTVHDPNLTQFSSSRSPTSQGSNPTPDGDGDNNRSLLRTVRQEAEGLRAELARCQLRSHQDEQRRLEMQQEFNRQIEDLQASQRQQFQILQQKHAKEKAAEHSELISCTNDLSACRRHCSELEQQIKALQASADNQKTHQQAEAKLQESQVIISRLAAQLREQASISASHEATAQQEVSELKRRLEEMDRRLAAAQQETQNLHLTVHTHTESEMAWQQKQARLSAELQGKDLELAELREQLEQKDQEINTYVTELDNLQSVLDVFQREREAEIRTRSSATTQAMDALREELAEERQSAVRRKEAEAKLQASFQASIRAKEQQIDALEKKIHGLLETMETQMKRMNDDNVVDKTLVNHLFLRYWNMRNDNNGIEVLKVMAKILNWDENLQRKVGIIGGGGFWSALLRPAETDDMPVTAQDVAISDLWLKFLERQVENAPPKASSMEAISCKEFQKKP